MKRRFLSFLAVLLGVTLLVGACSSSGSTPDASGDGDATETDSGSDAGADALADLVNADDCVDPELAETAVEGTWKIGFSLPTSGPLAGVVETFKTGYQARMDLANENGDVEGVEIDVTYADDEFKPDRTKANVTEFIQKDGMNSLSTFGSGQVGAVADMQNADCVPMLYPSAGVQDYFDVEEFPWTAQFLIPNEREAAFDVAVIQERFPDGATVGIAENETASGAGYSGSFQAAAEETDGKVEVVVVAPTGDPADAAAKLKEADPDVVFLAEVTPGCAAMASALDRVGFEPEMIINASNCVSTAALAAAGDAAAGVMIPSWAMVPTTEGALDDPALAELADRIGEDVAKDQQAVAGWIAADLTVKNLQDAAGMDGGLSPLNVMRAARSMDDYHSPLLIEGINWSSIPPRTLGVTALQLSEWDVDAQSYVYVGDPIPVD